MIETIVALVLIGAVLLRDRWCDKITSCKVVEQKEELKRLFAHSPERGDL